MCIRDRTDDVELIQLNSFGCGLDAVTTDQVEEITKKNNKLYTVLKIDEGTNMGAVKIRIRSLKAAMEEREKNHIVHKDDDTPYERVYFTKEMSKDYTILIPEIDVYKRQVYKKFNSGDTTLMAVFFDEGTSADGSLEAVAKIRQIGGKQCFVSSMTAFVEDLKELAEKEEPIYVGLAVLLCCIILAIFMDSWMIPVVFMAGIGMAILYNLGSNFFLGQVSYITKALSAVLQLGVTMDYSIFLWHSYEEQRQDPSKDKNAAMAQAISNTFASITGSSITTVAAVSYTHLDVYKRQSLHRGRSRHRTCHFQPSWRR